MSSIKAILLLISFIIFFGSCARPQNKQENMKATTQKLIEYLMRSDSTSISLLIEDDYRRKYKSARIKKDSKEFQQVVNKYGLPTTDQMQFSKGENDENVISISLMNTTSDSAFNLKECHLVVFFYPDRFLKNATTIYNYSIIRVPLREPERKLIIAPHIRNQK